MHLLLHALLDFDETWSETSVGKWLQKLSTVWPQRSCRGHRGQKGHFTENATPRTHYIAGGRDSCILTILTSSTKLITLQVSLGSFGVTGVKQQGQITNNFKCQKWLCQCVDVGLICISVHGDLFIRLTIKGSKVKDRSNYKMCQMTKVKGSMC